MANVDNPHGFAPERINGGGAIPLEERYTVSNVTVALGDALILTGGLINLAGSTSTAILGVAAMPLTGSAGVRQKCLYWPAQENVVFSGQCSGNGTIGIVGQSVAIEGTTGIMELDENDTSPGVAHIIDLKPGSTYDSHAEFLFVWKSSEFTGQA